MHTLGAALTPLPLVRPAPVRDEPVHLFIYHVRAQHGPRAAGDETCFFAVLVRGLQRAAAEAIAINAAHQAGYHIMRADTVAEVDAATVQELVDGAALVRELACYGVASRCLPTAVAA